jgi:hypothetical protein
VKQKNRKPRTALWKSFALVLEKCRYNAALHFPILKLLG